MVTLGSLGEGQVAGHLEMLGYKIIARNWRCERGEIDIVAWDGDTLVFIEVKTRQSQRCGHPAEAVHTEKQQRLRLVARHYIHTTGQTAPAYRFDVAAVDAAKGQIHLIKDAF